MVMPNPYAWFSEARYGLFIHWGPYAQYGRGEQVLLRERLDQRAYAARACAWHPRGCDLRAWARAACDGGFRYAVLTTRHHDGYCLWDTRLTDYGSAAQAPGRDFVAEFVDAFRAEGLRIGLYYSLADWRIPAYWDGPGLDPAGWGTFRDYVYGQVRELLSQYGRIDELWFDGAWPRTPEEWGAEALATEIRRLQPEILLNNRLGIPGDFGTPEHAITPEARPWESCQTTTWRLWGYAAGERWRPADVWLDMLVECAASGGNLLLNVGPDAEGHLPPDFLAASQEVGDWLRTHGEAIYGPGGGDLCEFVTCGRQTIRGNNLYLLIRFWSGEAALRLVGLATPVRAVTLLTTGAPLEFTQDGDVLLIHGLPAAAPTPLFPVIRVTCDGPPEPTPAARERLWSGDPAAFRDWAAARGASVMANGD